MIRIGTKLYGYCGGFFGSSSEDKRVEGIGVDWVVARDLNGKVFGFFADDYYTIDDLEEYTIPKDED